MSELLDKQVYVLNECFKYKFRDSRRGSRKPTKSVRLYQKTGWSDFDELWVTDSTLNEGTNSLIKERKGAGQMVRHALSQNERHKTRNG